MELKEKLRQILKERYGMENDAEIIKEIRTSTTRDENKQQEFIRMLENINENSNPILVIATLK